MTTLTYNAQNRITDILDPAGGATHITYDAKGNLASTKDPAGALSYTYDNEGQLTNARGTGLTFDYNHRLGIGSDTQFSYDGRGSRLIATRVGVTTHYIYDPSTYRLSSDTHEACYIAVSLAFN